jgi:dTDP-4-amino-4,6-dideoxygalactose transaminase
MSQARIGYRFSYPITKAMRSALTEAAESRVHFRGKWTSQVEAKMARLCRVTYAVAANSGSGCMLLATHALGFGPGDEVIMPANAYAPIVESTLFVGARPVLVDVDPETANIEVDRIVPTITEKTRGIVVQHNYGHAVDMDPILELARRHEFRILEDAAHTMGALYQGRPTGGLGDIGVFGFSNKGISPCGVGGIATTSNEQMANEMRLRCNHGRSPSGESLLLGYNFKLTELVAAVASVQLDMLSDWNTRRRENAHLYTALLSEAGLPLRLPVEKDYAHHVYLHYVVRVPDAMLRDPLREHLLAEGIETSVHFPYSVHTQKAFAQRLPYRRGEFPVAEQWAERSISLPCNPGVGPEDIERVVAGITSFFSRQRGNASRGCTSCPPACEVKGRSPSFQGD